MKKKVVAILLVVITVMSMVACGASKVEGKWESTAAKVGDKEMKWDEMGKDAAANKATLTFEGDKVTAEIMGKKEDASFKMDGDTINIDDGKEKLTAKLEGSRIALEQSGVTIYFEKK